MSHNILLVDNELKILEHVLNNTDWIISVLITENKKKCISSNRIKKIYVYDDFRNNNDFTLFDYKDLEKLWKAQLKVENCYNRFSTDYQMGKLFYYRGYALIKQIFDSNMIDFVIIKGMNHGYPWDRLLAEYATLKKIHSYNAECMLNNTRIVFDNLENKILKVNEKKACIEDTIFYKEEVHLQNSFGNNIWGRIYKFVYKCFGALGLDIIKCIRYKNVGNNIWNVNTLERMYYFKEVRKVEKYYKKISSPLNIQENYIYYALHLEPEAAVAGRCDMDSQIVAIMMLANHLPEGWKVVVKEHPMQFQYNTMAYYSFLMGVYRFRSKLFYKMLSEINNVRVVNIETDSREVIERAQAVATMNGTVIAEAILLNKPILSFGEERTIYNYCHDIYKIRSDTDCREAILKIKNGNEYRYDNYEELCNEYLIDFLDERLGYKKVVEVIREDVVNKEK